MKLKEKSKILKAVLLSLAAVVLVSAALLIYGAKSFEAKLRAQTAALKLQAEITDSVERLNVLRVQRALEREQNARDAMFETLHGRAEEFRQSLLILVNPWNNVPENYTVPLGEVEGYLVDRRAQRALSDMLDDCRAQGYLPIICSAFRTQEYQEMLYRNKILRLLDEGVSRQDAPEVAAQSVALPGTSEHQLGLAVDIISETYTNLDRFQERTEVQQWLMNNCWRYGFILRYPNGTSETTGIIYEPWHYRYVGYVTAKAVHDSGLVFEEYLKTLEDNTSAVQG